MIFLTIGYSSNDSIFQLLGVSILFIFILAITFYTTKIVGGAKLNQTKNSNFNVLETFKVTQNKHLQLIKIGTRYFVIAIGKDDIHLISELDETEVKLQDQLKKQSINFSEIITLVTNKQKEKKQNDDQEIDHK